MFHLSFTLNSSSFDLSLIDEVVLVADELSSSVGNFIEMSIVGIFFRGVDDAFTGHLFIIPVTHIVFILFFVFVPFAAEGAASEF